MSCLFIYSPNIEICNESLENVLGVSQACFLFFMDNVIVVILTDCNVVILAFVVCGGIIFELLKLVPALWTFVMGLLAKIGIVGKGY